MEIKVEIKAAAGQGKLEKHPGIFPAHLVLGTCPAWIGGVVLAWGTLQHFLEGINGIYQSS